MNNPIHKHEGIIYSLRVNHGNDVFMEFYIKQFIDRLKITVTRIVEDNHDGVVFGIKRYNIFIVKQGSETEHLWKSYDNMPCVVCYDINQ